MILKVKVKLRSKHARLEKISEGEFVAHLSEPPEKGRANLELIKLLAKELGVSQGDVKIKTPSSRSKIVEIS